ncbi:MAG: glycosyltransferase family 1 protein [Bacteroidales bacterium]|jgi:glycosyltransferase involved in cell wall biosynthesis|nr:glycosyltransferase family 4 protein [Bacteroidales bacterium]MDI9576422.1 glycosyltransferase family 1 protein [Bacteroidota bacterium]MDD2593263.1 glycosyltransferase family 1 protein [Bacteroidales bacterium]MDD3754847.1 glycosyltransferase family 1 protein [Bacteroidales bacterium]MDY0400113.1 glycosyltransferase family 1 protein [Bacteroidales bacterium]
MRIAVNTRFLLYQRLSGFGVFIEEIFSRLVKEHPEVEFTFIFDRPYHSSFIYNTNVTPKVLYPPARHPILKYIYYQISLKRYINNNKFDLFISPDSELPLHLKCPSLLVLHDLNFMYDHKYLPLSDRRYMLYFTPKFLKHATRIITVSEFSKHDIEHNFPFTNNKVGIVYNAASEKFKPLSEQKIQKFREKYSKGKPYFLFVGVITPRKNLANLLKAYSIFREMSDIDYPLIIGGNKIHKYKEFEKELKNNKYSSDIFLIGKVLDEEIASLIGSAYSLVFPSKFEGFGIPIIEAMKSGIPVITSNVSSMPEVAGDAALLVDPYNPRSIADAMLLLTKSNDLYVDLKNKGLERAKSFSWDISAKKMWEEIEKTIGIS